MRVRVAVEDEYRPLTWSPGTCSRVGICAAIAANAAVQLQAAMQLSDMYVGPARSEREQSHVSALPDFCRQALAYGFPQDSWELQFSLDSGGVGPYRRLVASHQHFYDSVLRTWDYGRLLHFPNLKANEHQ
jgi:hypothetical protein